MPEPRDIETRDDVERLVRAFYSKALTDPIIGFIFTDVAHLDLDEHVPVITSFWETVLLGGRSYSGGAFAPHAVLHGKVGLKAGHFERWLKLWFGTVDELYTGQVADQAKVHALRVGQAFLRRLEGFPGPVTPAPIMPTGLAVTRHGGDGEAA